MRLILLCACKRLPSLGPGRALWRTRLFRTGGAVERPVRIAVRGPREAGHAGFVGFGLGTCRVVGDAHGKRQGDGDPGQAFVESLGHDGGGFDGAIIERAEPAFRVEKA